MVDTMRPDDKSVMTYVSAYYHTFAHIYKVWFKTILCFAVSMSCMLPSIYFHCFLHEFMSFACCMRFSFYRNQ